MNNLIIGNTSLELAEWAKLNFPKSQLLTDNNFLMSLDTDDDFYTSLADLTQQNLIKAIQISKRVIYKNIGAWMDLQFKESTEQLLYRSNRLIENFTLNDVDRDPGNVLWNVDSRQNNDNQLWIVGGSNDQGVGLLPNQERYGDLIAKNLRMPVTFLTCPGTSIYWGADQILRSDVKKGDIIIWGLPGINRYVVYKNNVEINVYNDIFNDNQIDYRKILVGQEHRPNIVLLFSRLEKYIKNISKQDKHDLELGQLSEDRLMYAIKAIFQVINFCKKLDVKLVFFLYPISTQEFDNFLIRYIGLLDNFLHYDVEKSLIDFASDNMHSGPESHRMWADTVIKFIRDKNYI